jgi:hypothetical protein
MNKEAIELLEKAYQLGHHNHYVYDKPRDCIFCLVKEVLTLLRVEPEAGEFTKATRQAMTEFLNIYGKNSEIFPPIGAEQVIELCDTIDHKDILLKNREREVIAYKAECDRLTAELKKLRQTKCPPIADGDTCICPIEELEEELKEYKNAENSVKDEVS